MKFYINVGIPVIGLGDAISGYSIAIDVLQHSVEELQTTREARGREEFKRRDEAQRREEYRTRGNSPSRERYEAREQVRATEETRSTEEYRARGSEDQTEMPQHQRCGHRRRGYYPNPELWSDSDSEQSRDNRFDHSHNLADAVGLGISCGCQLRPCGLQARPGQDPNRAGPPQVSETNSNAARRPPVPGTPGRFDQRLENLMHCNGRPTFPSAGDAPIQANRAYQSPAGDSHAAASPADASRNHPRRREETAREWAFRLSNESVRPSWIPDIMNALRRLPTSDDVRR